MNPTEAQTRLPFLLEAREVLDAQIDEAKAALGLRRRRRSRREIPDCGTESAYQRHIYQGEPTDPECRAAHAEYNRKGY